MRVAGTCRAGLLTYEFPNRSREHPCTTFDAPVTAHIWWCQPFAHSPRRTRLIRTICVCGGVCGAARTPCSLCWVLRVAPACLRACVRVRCPRAQWSPYCTFLRNRLSLSDNTFLPCAGPCVCEHVVCIGKHEHACIGDAGKQGNPHSPPKSTCLLILSVRVCMCTEGVFSLASIKASVEAAVAAAAAEPEAERRKRIRQLQLRWHPGECLVGQC